MDLHLFVPAMMETKMKLTLISLLILLSGCVATTQDEYVPPILFSANTQAHIIVIVGSESIANWDDVVIDTADNDPPCEAKYPESGPMVPGDTIHIITALPDDICRIQVTYNGQLLGAWTFQPSYQIDFEDGETITQQSQQQGVPE